jgi:hypothetical protein
MLAMKASQFVEKHIVSEIPPHLVDLFDHDEGTYTGRLLALALMLLSANIVGLALRMIFLS